MDFPKRIRDSLWTDRANDIVAWFLATAWAVSFQLTVRKGSYELYDYTAREDCFIRRLHASSHFVDIIRKVL